jgi:tetratricopeptide (TPR) repeat protein
MKKVVFGTILFIVLLVNGCKSFALQTGQVEYTIPIDYSLIDEKALATDADTLFRLYTNSTDMKDKKEYLDRMLSSYNILAKINKENPLYFTRLGIIYDKLGKDRWAKSNFCRSSNLEPNNAYAFYSFGNYYYDRYEYKKALREYKRAYDCGYNKDFNTLYQIGCIYEKYGDYSSAIRYFKNAKRYKSSTDLTNRITSLEELLEKNSLYDQNRGLNK